MITLKQLNTFIKGQYPGLDIELVKGDGYFYFTGDDGFDLVDSIYVNALNQPTIEWWHDTIKTSIDASGAKTKIELRSLERMISYMFEMYSKSVVETQAKFIENPIRFFEWNVESAWAEAIIFAELTRLKKTWDDCVVTLEDDEYKMRAICRVILSFAVKRAERKIDSSTYAAREAQSIAEQSAYAHLCSMYQSTHIYVRDNLPEMYDDYLEQIDHAIMRGF